MPGSSRSSDLKTRLDFLGLDETQRKALAALSPFVGQNIGPALDAFYSKARAEPQTARFFRDGNHVQNAKSRQQAHWSLIVSGRFDEDYAQSVTKIGQTHARLGLAPRWYIGAYEIVLEQLFGKLINEELNGFLQAKQAERLKGKMAALLKAAMLDMDYSISAYLDSLEEQRVAAESARDALEQEQVEALDVLESALESLGQGDLTVTIEGRVGERFNGLAGKFDQAIGALSTAFAAVVTEAEKTLTSSRELSSTTDEMAKRTEQQAAALEETAAALEEINTVTKQAAQRTAEARKAAVASADNAERSGKVVDEAVLAMGEIETSSVKIEQIIGVIDDISFQTNLLALNAGVEAARAGEAGKGFAVVAQEVRELAQRSAAAAKEIRGLIARSSEDVTKGVALVNRTGEALRAIGEQVRDINEHIAAIATSADEQSAGVGEISSAINSMDQMTQRNAAMVEETNAATRELETIAAHLNGLTRGLRLARHDGTGNVRRGGMSRAA